MRRPFVLAFVVLAPAFLEVAWAGVRGAVDNLQRMVFVRALDELAPADLSHIGGKARSCANLRRGGFDVPDGFVVHCDAGSIPHDAIAAALRRLGDGPFAVRSSAVEEDSVRHSFAGVHQTRLGVAGAQVAEAVAACLASMRGEEAAAYRRAHGLPPIEGPQSVLVQRMIPAVVAGVAFTTDPVRAGRNEMVISASWGSGEAVVGGMVEPDEVRVLRSTRGIVSQFVGSKAYRLVSNGHGQQRVPTSSDEQARLCLDAAQVAVLTSLLLDIETTLGETQDVEWCHDGDRFWFVQSRPITAAVRREAAHVGIEWTRTNVREVLPDLPSPQTLDFLIRLLNTAMRNYFGPLLAPEAELGPMCKAIGGRAYFNLSQFRHLARASLMPPGILMKAMGHSDGVHPEDMRIALPPLGKFVRSMPALARVVLDQLLMGWKMNRLFDQGRRYLHELRRVPMDERSDLQLIALLEEFEETGEEPLRSAFANGSMVQWQLLLEMICHRVDFPYERLLNTQLAVGEKTVSSQQAYDLLTLAQIGRADERVVGYFAQQAENDPEYRNLGRSLRGSLFKRELQAFLDNYGHRGTYETDWSLPRYSEDPTPLYFTLGQLVTAPTMQTPQAIERRLQYEADAAWDAFRRSVPTTWRELLLPLVRWVLGLIKKMFIFRERNRFEMVKVLEPLRGVAVVMSQRFVGRGWIDRADDYFLLTVDEIREAVHDIEKARGLRAIVKRRAAEQMRFARLDMPLFLREDDVEAVLNGAVEPAVAADGVRRLRGMCTSPGCVEAPVIIMHHAGEFSRMRPGAIIVTPATDPSWTPLFTLAAGVVVEIGGTLSHASTIAREYGLPALANVKDATRLLRDGEMVRLDATAGYVERLG